LIATQPPSSAGILPRDFDRIFREHYEFVHRTAERVTGNAQDAEDVLQTLFLRLLGRELSGDVQANPRAYLYRATVNIALDVLRARKRRPVSDHSAAMLEEPAARTASRGEEDFLARLREALAELNPKAVEILILRHVHGYSDAEIAKLLGTSRGTIAVSLFRTRARLRKSIRGYLEKRQ
jgi:RNA polymerase sigma-70 factor (ECF subfamily)